MNLVVSINLIKINSASLYFYLSELASLKKIFTTPVKGRHTRHMRMLLRHEVIALHEISRNYAYILW